MRFLNERFQEVYDHCKMEEFRAQYKKNFTQKACDRLSSLVLNYACPVLGTLPVPWQETLRERYAALKGLEASTAVTSSAIALFCGGLIGLGMNGFDNPLGFPMKVGYYGMGSEVMRYTSLVGIPYGVVQAASYYSLADSTVRLYLNLIKKTPKGAFLFEGMRWLAGKIKTSEGASQQGEELIAQQQAEATLAERFGHLTRKSTEELIEEVSLRLYKAHARGDKDEGRRLQTELEGLLRQEP